MTAECTFDGSVVARRQRRGGGTGGNGSTMTKARCVVSLRVAWICLVTRQMSIETMLAFLEVASCIVVAEYCACRGGSGVGEVAFTLGVS